MIAHQPTLPPGGSGPHPTETIAGQPSHLPVLTVTASWGYAPRNVYPLSPREPQAYEEDCRMNKAFKPGINWLIVFVPICFLVNYVPALKNEIVLFVCSCPLHGCSVESHQHSHRAFGGPAWVPRSGVCSTPRSATSLRSYSVPWPSTTAWAPW